MPRIRECPKCGANISHTYSPAEPDVGIFTSTGWYCGACDLLVEDDDDDYNRSHRLELRHGN